MDENSQNASGSSRTRLFSCSVPVSVRDVRSSWLLVVDSDGYDAKIRRDDGDGA